MKSRSAIIILILVAASAITAFSQTAPAGTTRIAVINSSAFTDPKEGVTRLVKAYTDLEAEFKPTTDELATINKQIDTLGKEIQRLQDQLNAPAGGPPIDRNAIQASISSKTDEGTNLQIRFKRRQEDAKAQYERKEKQVTEPVYKDLLAALEAYGKKNSIDLILDITKFDGGLFLINNAADITLPFIKDFNAKSAGVPVKP